MVADRATTCSYEVNGRLTSENSTTFGYDWVGNRTQPNGLVYNNADELTSWPGQYTYAYFGDGAMKEVKDTSYQVVQSYTYTPAGLMWGETHGLPPNQWSTTHVWDTDGNRVMYEPVGVYQAKRWFVHDVTAGVPARVVEVAQTGTPNLAYHYFYREPDGSLIAMFTPPEIIPPAGATGGGATTSLPDGTWRFYHFDGLGSSRALTDAAGAVTDRYTYDAWGNAQHTFGSTSQPFQFVGRLGYFKHELGFQPLQLGVRLHDPQVGRFTQRDPIRVRFGAYGYAANLPTRLIDPSGLHVCYKLDPNGKIDPDANCEQCKDEMFGECSGRAGGHLVTDCEEITNSCFAYYCDPTGQGYINANIWKPGLGEDTDGFRHCVNTLTRKMGIGTIMHLAPLEPVPTAVAQM